MQYFSGNSLNKRNGKTTSPRVYLKKITVYDLLTNYLKSIFTLSTAIYLSFRLVNNTPSLLCFASVSRNDFFVFFYRVSRQQSSDTRYLLFFLIYSTGLERKKLFTSSKPWEFTFSNLYFALLPNPSLFFLQRGTPSC